MSEIHWPLHTSKFLYLSHSWWRQVTYYGRCPSTCRNTRPVLHLRALADPRPGASEWRTAESANLAQHNRRWIQAGVSASVHRRSFDKYWSLLRRKYWSLLRCTYWTLLRCKFWGLLHFKYGTCLIVRKVDIVQEEDFILSQYTVDCNVLYPDICRIMKVKTTSGKYL